MGLLVTSIPALAGNAGGQGPCSGQACTALLSGAIGGGLGYVIGRERDQNVRERWRMGPDLDYESEQRLLDFSPARIAAMSSGGAVIQGERGVAAVTPELEIIRRAGEIRGIRAVTALPERNALVAATAFGLYAFPLRVLSADDADGRGARIHPTGASALSVLAPGELLAGGVDRVSRLSLAGDGSGWTSSDAGHAGTRDKVAAITVTADDQTIWSLEGSVVRARAAATLEPLGELPLAVDGTRLAVHAGLGAVAAGAGGVYLLDLRAPASPRLISKIELDAARFATGVALAQQKLYAAAGEQGLVVVDVSAADQPRVIGVARGLGSVDDVAVSADGVYVVDHAAKRVRRLKL